VRSPRSSTIRRISAGAVEPQKIVLEDLHAAELRLRDRLARGRFAVTPTVVRAGPPVAAASRIDRIGPYREGRRKSGSQETRRWRETDSNPRSPSTVSSVHSGACDATHAAIVKPGTPDRSRRRARRAICGTPGAPYHGTARLLLAVTGQQRFEGALIGAAREELLTIDLGCCPRRAFAAGRPAAKVATFQWPCGAANSRSRLARPAARIFCTRRDQGLLYKRTPSENPSEQNGCSGGVSKLILKDTCKK
jgi:hypothetical protein